MNHVKLIISSFLILFSTTNIIGQDIAKNWYGVLEIGNTKLNVVFEITNEAGTFTTKLDYTDQGALDIPTDSTFLEGDSLVVICNNLDFVYKGEVAAAGNKISGTFTQYGNKYPLLLQDEIQETDKNRRPQDPTEINYYVEDVPIANYEDSIILAGTLTMPLVSDISKVVILLTGSGPQDRNGEDASTNHRPFLVLSDYLTSNGIAVLRYDDRGVEQSAGIYFSSTVADFAKDAKAAVDYIKSRLDLKNAKVGLIGHDEGGIVASMLHEEVDFLVYLNTPGTQIPQLLLNQSKLISKASNVPDSLIKSNDKVMRIAYSYLLKNKDIQDSVKYENLKEIFEIGMQYYPDSLKLSGDQLSQYTHRRAVSLLSPWFQHYLQIKPSDYNSKITKPLLALNGTLDLQVPYQENLIGIQNALKKAGNQQFELVALEGLNHMFQSAFTGSPLEYAKLTETFNQEAMDIILEWVRKQ